MPRELLPQRRASENITIEANGVFMTVTVGRYDDGRPGEVFTSDIKAGTAADSLLRDAAIVLSFALQHGASPVAMQSAVTRDRDGAPASFVGSLIDELVKETL